jgi:hypothetical protein
VHVQIARQRPRSQCPSPHSLSSVQSRSGTFWDQGRDQCALDIGKQSDAMAISSGENTSLGVGSGVVAAPAADDDGVCGVGYTTRSPGVASSIDRQATAPTSPTPDKSPHFVAVFSEKLNMKAGRREDFPEILLPAFM